MRFLPSDPPSYRHPWFLVQVQTWHPLPCRMQMPNRYCLRPLSSELKRLESQASKTNQTLTKIGEVGGKLENAGDSIANAGKKVSVASAAVTAMGGAAVKTAADFESSMSQVQATMGITKNSMSKVNGQSVNTMDTLSELAKTMGAKTAFRVISLNPKLFHCFGCTICWILQRQNNISKMRTAFCTFDTVVGQDTQCRIKFSGSSFDRLCCCTDSKDSFAKLNLIRHWVSWPTTVSKVQKIGRAHV